MSITGLFEKIFGGNKPPRREIEGFFDTLTAYQPAFRSWSGALYESELCRAAIHSKASHASKLKIECFGAAQPQLQTQLRVAPNEFQTWGQFLYRTSTILDMQNNAFIVPIRNRYDELVGIYPVLPSECEAKQYGGEPWLEYKFLNGNSATVKMADCGILNKFQYKDDLFGENNNALRSTMELVNIQNQGIEEGVRNSNTYRFMAQIGNLARPDDIKKEQKRFNNESFGGNAGGGVLIFPNTYQNIQQIHSTPFVVDADQMKIIQTNVYNYFGVNEDILQNKAVGDSWSAFYEGAVEPFAIQLSDILTQMLFTRREIAIGSGIMATANRLQYMSNTEKLAVSSRLADRGILNRDEIREIWNLPPLPNGEGQAYIMRGEYHDSSNEVSGTAEKEASNAD